jgi:hypothetical protein
MKSSNKWTSVVVSLVFVAFAFQNCSNQNATTSSNSNNTPVLYGDEAQDLISVMEKAGVVDFEAQNSLALPELVSLSTLNMTCSRLYNQTARQCLFKFRNEDGSYRTIKTTSAIVDKIIELLIAFRIQCSGNCNEVETYTVYNLKCAKNTVFPFQSKCMFTK